VPQKTLGILQKINLRLSRNLLKGQVGDEINVLMAACAWNLKKSSLTPT
jgi:hypothetical protein